ncbi:MAG: uroporphyrinogen-III C-methyltransferase [Pseudomonadota bacterium]|jgi:uroporphyrin-III C-methyltransferase
MNPCKLGKVHLIGAGPGAADLITVRGLRLLERADIVFHDALVDENMLDWCPQAIRVPVGKRCGKHACSQSFINKRLIDAAKRHAVVVRLKGGDPMMFGRADEEISALASAGIAVEVVPGVTSALAASASLNQSLTLRGVSRSVAFCTLAQADEAETAQLPPLPQADTLAIYMGRRHAAQIARQLLSLGKALDCPVCVIEAVSTPRERHLNLTLGELAQHGAQDWMSEGAPALLLIGAVFGHRQQYAEVFADRRLRA